LEWLIASEHPTVAYVDGVERKLLERFAAPTIRYDRERLDMSAVGRDCDMAVLNGTHGTTASILIAGKPVMQLPIYLEQGLLAHAVCRMGAGAQAPVAQPQSVIEQIAKVATSIQYAEAAKQFARKYASFDPIQSNEQVLDRIEEVLSRKPALLSS
jgi:UDP:flavonoid glycosyltransferase YjiC (YdhE family)